MFKISDDQTNIDKYRLAANITEYQQLVAKRIVAQTSATQSHC